MSNRLKQKVTKFGGARNSRFRNLIVWAKKPLPPYVIGLMEITVYMVQELFQQTFEFHSFIPLNIKSEYRIPTHT